MPNRTIGGGDDVEVSRGAPTRRKVPVEKGQFGWAHTPMPSVPVKPEATYVDHGHEERLFDTGEVTLNHVVVGEHDESGAPLDSRPDRVVVGLPGALPLLAEHFHTHVVDLRGQGRSSRTPGRYTLNLMGGDLVRFIDDVIGRPTIVSGLSSGGVLAAWLSAYAKPGQIIAAHYEDPPLFSSELVPSVGQGVRQSIGPVFELMHRFLGDQWSIGDWKGLGEAMQEALPPSLQMVGLGVRPRRGASAEPQGVRPGVGRGVLDGDRLPWVPA